MSFLKNNLYKSSLCGSVLMAVLLFGCSDEYGQELGPRPTGSFTVSPLAGEVNTYVLSSEVDNGFRYQWDIGEGFVEGQRQDTVYFAQAGTYPVRMRAMTRNGHALATKEVVVQTTDPASCINKIYGCDGEKTWVLAPEAGALVVGPPDNGVWWASSLADVTDAKRTCLFNDEYTFTEDMEFIMEDMGDMRVDDEGGNPWPTDIGLEIGCYSMEEIPEKYRAWGSGDFTYEISGNQLTLNGLGAHMGLYKVGDAAGNIPEPAESVTYTILELTNDRLVIEKRYDWGYWKFTFVPKP